MGVRKNRYAQRLAKFSEKGFEVKLEKQHLTIRKGLECGLITMVCNPDVRRKDIVGYTVPRFKGMIWRLIKEFRAMRRMKRH